MDARADPLEARHLEIDVLRTVAVICMVIYHAAFDFAFFFHFPLDPLDGGWFLLQRFTANLFLLIVGVSFAISYGRMRQQGAGRRAIVAKYWKRAAVLLGCAALISGVTYLSLGNEWIRFGALHLIGTTLLLLPFLMPFKEGTALLALLILFLSPFLREVSVGSSLFLPLGLPPRSFASVDYLPMIPWMAPVLFGTALGNMLYNRRWLRRHLPKNRFTVLLGLPGRHALLLYLLHQPVLLAILWIFF